MDSLLDWFSLEGRTVVVTGATRGLGREMCRGLSGVGARVVVVGRDGARAEAVSAELRAAGGDAVPATCDVADEAQVLAMVEDVVERCGPPDVLVNNAGVAPEGPLLGMAADAVRTAFDTNLLGTVLVTQAFGPHLVRQEGASVINIGSVDGVVGTPGLVAYCASKGGIVQFTRALAAEWARHGVRVNCLCPGYFATDVNAAQLADPQLLDKVLRRIPLRRLGQPEELVPAVLFLASAASQYMTGQLLVVDGGESAR
jgi:2-deoxy-D-gluconate 3-dehydrogenase